MPYALSVPLPPPINLPSPWREIKPSLEYLQHLEEIKAKQPEFEPRFKTEAERDQAFEFIGTLYDDFDGTITSRFQRMFADHTECLGRVGDLDYAPGWEPTENLSGRVYWVEYSHAVDPHRHLCCRVVYHAECRGNRDWYLTQVLINQGKTLAIGQKRSLRECKAEARRWATYTYWCNHYLPSKGIRSLIVED